MIVAPALPALAVREVADVAVLAILRKASLLAIEVVADIFSTRVTTARAAGLAAVGGASIARASIARTVALLRVSELVLRLVALGLQLALTSRHARQIRAPTHARRGRADVRRARDVGEGDSDGGRAIKERAMLAADKLDGEVAVFFVAESAGIDSLNNAAIHSEGNAGFTVNCTPRKSLSGRSNY